jgi:hypothetical protein
MKGNRFINTREQRRYRRHSLTRASLGLSLLADRLRRQCKLMDETLEIVLPPGSEMYFRRAQATSTGDNGTTRSTVRVECDQYSWFSILLVAHWLPVIWQSASVGTNRAQPFSLVVSTKSPKSSEHEYLCKLCTYLLKQEEKKKSNPTRELCSRPRLRLQDPTDTPAPCKPRFSVHCNAHHNQTCHACPL